MKTTRISVIILLIVLSVRLASVFSYAPKQLIHHEKLLQIWLHSQYNLNQGYEFYGNMSDEDLRAFAALEYIRGRDPSVVNFEDPPLGKYLIGLSYLFLGNILLVQFAASAGILLLTSLLARRLSLTPPYSLLPLLILVFDPLFVERASTVNLEIIQLLFALLALLILTSPLRSSLSFFLLGLTIGGVMASKVFFVGLLLLLYVFVILFLRRNPKLVSSILLVSLGSLLAYLGSYAMYFSYHSPTDFLNLHIAIVRLYRSYLPEYPWFEIWRILLLGKWRTWFVTPLIQPVSEYWLAWPTATIISGSLLFMKRTWKIPLQQTTVLLGWVLVYLLFQSIHVVFPRYLLLILPILYILAIRQLVNFISGYRHNYHTLLAP